MACCDATQDDARITEARMSGNPDAARYFLDR